MDYHNLFQHWENMLIILRYVHSKFGMKYWKDSKNNQNICMIKIGKVHIWDVQFFCVPGETKSYVLKYIYKSWPSITIKIVCLDSKMSVEHIENAIQEGVL